MVCADGLDTSGECMEHQDGVPSTAGEGVTTDLTSKDDRPRCPHCKAWVSADGQCRNPRCSRNGEQVVEGDVQFSQRPEVRAAARDLGEEAEIVRVIVEGADPETLQDVVAQTEQDAGVTDWGSHSNRWREFERVEGMDATIRERPTEVMAMVAEKDQRFKAAPDGSVVADGNISVNFAFDTSGRGGWDREGVVSAGPAEPAEPFEPGAELIDEYEALADRDPWGRIGAKERYTPVRIYEVRMEVPAEEVVEAPTFDGLAREAKDRVPGRSYSEVEPHRLEVEHRPSGALWVTGTFEVVPD